GSITNNAGATIIFNGFANQTSGTLDANIINADGATITVATTRRGNIVGDLTNNGVIALDTNNTTQASLTIVGNLINNNTLLVKNPLAGVSFIHLNVTGLLSNNGTLFMTTVGASNGLTLTAGRLFLAQSGTFSIQGTGNIVISGGSF